MKENKKNHQLLPSPPLASAGTMEADDPAKFEHTAQPWELMVKPLDKNTFAHCKTYLITPSIIIYKESFASAIQIHGLTPDRMLSFTIPLKLGKQSLYWDKPINQREIPASLPGGLDVVLDAGQAHIIVLIELSLLERMLTKEQLTALKYAASQRRLPIIERALDAFTQWLLNLLDQTQQQTNIFQYASVLRSLEEDLLQHLLNVVRLPLQIPARDSREKRRLGFERALEFLREADLSSLSVPEICDKAEVSQRTLEYAFREHFNITPIHFIRKLRLHAVRKTLLTAHVNDITISDTAHQYGIYDMGRFASTYKSHFDELPSQTLAKPAIKNINPFAHFI
ncbi:MAG: helix-turn-helix domain-containing protein [Methyloprofundus sp.]|nr:helix-turn-helix domain-containing protein [Methyloprofundus sp.]